MSPCSTLLTARSLEKAHWSKAVQSPLGHVSLSPLGFLGFHPLVRNRNNADRDDTNRYEDEIILDKLDVAKPEAGHQEQAYPNRSPHDIV